MSDGVEVTGNATGAADAAGISDVMGADTGGACIVAMAGLAELDSGFRWRVISESCSSWPRTNAGCSK
jgi:hypothetical protein